MAFPGVRIDYEYPFLKRVDLPTCISTSSSGVWICNLLHLPTVCDPWADTQVFIEHDHRYTF